MEKMGLGVSFFFSLTAKGFKEIFHIIIFAFAIGLGSFCKGWHIECEMYIC